MAAIFDFSSPYDISTDPQDEPYYAQDALYYAPVRDLEQGARLLAIASIDEATSPGTGLGAFHQSQRQIADTWKALKQVPCQHFAPPNTIAVRSIRIYACSDTDCNHKGLATSTVKTSTPFMEEEATFSRWQGYHQVRWELVMPNGAFYLNFGDSTGAWIWRGTHAPSSGNRMAEIDAVADQTMVTYPGTWKVRLTIDLSVRQFAVFSVVRG